MRRSVLLSTCVVAALLCSGSSVDAAPVRRLGRLQQGAEGPIATSVIPDSAFDGVLAARAAAAESTNVGLTPKEICVAKCAAEAAVCVHNCPKATGGMLGGCKENCALTGAECAGECAFEEEEKSDAAEVIDSSNVAAAFKEINAEAAVVSAAAAIATDIVVGLTPKEICVAKCAARASVCLHNCPKSAGGMLGGCKENCALSGAECAGECAFDDSADDVLAEDQKAFASFKVAFGKSYTSDALEARRFAIFQSNLRRAEKLNIRVPTAKFGVTRFMDLDPSEFSRTHTNFRPAMEGSDSALLRQGVATTFVPNTTIPKSYDWRKPDGGRPVGVTAVKDQGQCGSCWAFSATEALESATILAGKPSVPLSVEQTVDCDSVDGGCNGGDTVTAYAYMQKAGGVVSEDAYPYTAGGSGAASTCSFDKSQVKAKLKSFTYATPTCSDKCEKQDEALLAANLYHNGPVSICVDASPWQVYMGGILTNDAGCSGAYDQLDHCVQLVGYGVDSSSGQKYWSVRNSWADSWGEEGYIRLAFGSNTCGVADEATQVTV